MKSRIVSSAVGDGLIPWTSQWVVVVIDRDDPLPADDVDNGFVFSHIILHFLLNEGIVLQ